MLSARYAIASGISLFFWIVPISVKAPKPVILFSLIGSCGGFLYAYTLAGPLAKQIWYQQQEETQEREILLHDFALKELVMKKQLEFEYLGPAQLEEEAIALEQGQQNLKEAPQQKLLPDALPESLKTIIDLVKGNDGSMTQRDLARKTKLKADQIQAAFKELQSRGYGNITSDGRTYTFHLTRQAG